MYTINVYNIRILKVRIPVKRSCPNPTQLPRKNVYNNCIRRVFENGPKLKTVRRGAIGYGREVIVFGIGQRKKR